MPWQWKSHLLASRSAHWSQAAFAPTGRGAPDRMRRICCRTTSHPWARSTSCCKPSKDARKAEELLNELYLELKSEVYVRINAGFPHKGSLERRAQHIWLSSIEWSIEFPEKRKASVVLSLSDLISANTRARTAAQRATVDATLGELGSRAALRGLPQGFAAATMSAMQEATMDFIARQPKQRKKLIELAFQVFWRAVR